MTAKIIYIFFLIWPRQAQELNAPVYIMIYNLFPVKSMFVYDIYKLLPVHSQIGSR